MVDPVIGTPPLKWKLLAELLPKAAGRVLDCGCGDGGFAAYLALMGWEVLGVERDPARVSAARRAGVRVEERDLSDPAAWGTERWDAVVFADVLEHVEDPAAMLERAIAVLRPGGGILVSIPNIAYWRVRVHLLGGRWDYRDAGILDRTHRWFFTLSSWSDLLNRAGLTVAEWRGLPAWAPGLSSWRRTLHAWLGRLRPAVFATGFLFWLRPSTPRAVHPYL